MKRNTLSQSGRSMVEMLGTLAIIGVLSVGGIMGYSYGMDKWRANETINDISLRAVDLTNQLSNGRVPNFDEWQNEQTLYPMDVVHNNSVGQYAIVVENVPSRVCKMIGDSLKKQVDIYVGSDILTDETDETNDPCDESERNTMEFYFDTISCDPACNEGEYCEFGFCFKESGIPEVKDSTCGQQGQSCTTEDGENGFCESGDCVPLGSCTSNDDCGPKEYCAVINYTDGSTRFPEGVKGTCSKVNFLRHEIDGMIYYVSATDLNWWNAEWACEKIGKEHLDLKTFFIYNGDRREEPSKFSVDLSKLIGKLYVWTKTKYDNYHHSTPMIGTTTLGLDQNSKCHDRVAVCK